MDLNQEIRIFKNYDGKISEITDLCRSISLSRSINEVSRRMSGSIFYGITDRQINIGNLGRMQIGTGTKIWITLDGQEIFRGIVVDRTLSSDNVLEFEAFDYGFYLNKNSVTLSFNNTTADEATRAILKEINVEAGNIASSNIKLRRLLPQKEAHKAIMEMYTQVTKQTGQMYFVTMSGEKVNVIELGSTLTSKAIMPCKNPKIANGNLIAFSYKDNMTNMVNRVKIYDDKNNYVTQVNDNSTISYYGLIQQNYVKEKDKDYNTVAKKMFHGLDREVTVEILGDWNYRTGYACIVKIPYVDILQNTLMYIVGDTHTWNMLTGTFQTQLTLSFVKKMDTQDSDATEKFNKKEQKSITRQTKKKTSKKTTRHTRRKK